MVSGREVSGPGVIRTGVVLPTFRETPDEAFDVAEQAAEAGVDGVFCYDHIWPLGQPDRPALAPFPILGALAARLKPREDGRGGPFLGTLVARVGLVPNSVLEAQFAALQGLAPGRVIAGLGTGDHGSEGENRAYGIPFPPAAERRSALVELGRVLVDRGVVVWAAGGKDARTEEARAARSRAEPLGRRCRPRGRPCRPRWVPGARGHLGRAAPTDRAVAGGAGGHVAHRRSQLGGVRLAGRSGRARAGRDRVRGLIPHAIAAGSPRRRR